MTDDRMSGVALIAGSAGVIITLILHPSGPIQPERIDSVVRMLVVVHSLALASLPLWFLGALGLSRRGPVPDRIAIAALVLYGFGMVAVMNSVVFDGLVSPTLLRHIVAAPPTTGDTWHILSSYNGSVDQAFLEVFVAASAAAIVLWSTSIIRNGTLPRGAAIYGFIVGPVSLIVVFSGIPNRTPHASSLVIFAQIAWFMIVGILLCRVPGAE
jgi:hypothetical protein